MRNLSIVERLILRNQYKILYQVSTSYKDKSHYKKIIESLEKGFEVYYSQNMDDFEGVFTDLKPESDIIEIKKGKENKSTSKKTKEYKKSANIFQSDKTTGGRVYDFTSGEDSFDFSNLDFTSGSNSSNSTNLDEKFDSINFDDLDFNNSSNKDPFSDSSFTGFTYDPTDKKQVKSNTKPKEKSLPSLFLTSIFWVILCILVLYILLIK